MIARRQNTSIFSSTNLYRLVKTIDNDNKSGQIMMGERRVNRRGGERRKIRIERRGGGRLTRGLGGGVQVFEQTV